MDGCEKSPQPLAVVNQKRAIEIEIEFERGKSIPFFSWLECFYGPIALTGENLLLYFFCFWLID